MKMIKVSGGKLAKVSDEDFIIDSYGKWSGSCGYAMRNVKGEHIYMHRLIAQRMGFDMSKDVDHINRDRLDNRRENLRMSNHHSNGFNHGISKNNTSGVKGVRRLTNSDLWVAQIMFNRKKIHIGVYDSKIEAKKAYNDVARKLFREFAYINPE